MSHLGGISSAGDAAIDQHVDVDILNSSAANISSGATFTGNWASTLGVNSIQFTLVTNQPCRVYIDQCTTIGTADVTDCFYYNPNLTLPTFGYTVQAVGAYWRIRVTNIGAATATGVRLNSVLCPIADPLPRALDFYGNLKVAQYGQYSSFGDTARMSPHGFIDTNQPYRLLGTMFGTVADGYDQQFWTPSLLGASGGAAAAIATSGIVTLTSGTTNPSHSQLQTVRRARYTNLNAHRAYLRVRTPTVVVAGSTRIWGAFTTSGSPLAPAEGYCFDVDSAGVLNISCYVGGSRVGRTVASGAFNGDVIAYTVDTNSHAYEVVWTISKIRFVIDGVLIHTMNAITAPLSGTQHLPITFLALGTGSSCTMDLWSGSITRLGRDATAPIMKAFVATAGTALKIGPGRLHRMIVDTGNNAATISIYDSATTTANLISTTNLSANAAPVSLEFQGDFYNGLYIVITGASANVTVVYE